MTSSDDEEEEEEEGENSRKHLKRKKQSKQPAFLTQTSSGRTPKATSRYVAAVNESAKRPKEEGKKLNKKIGVTIKKSSDSDSSFESTILGLGNPIIIFIIRVVLRGGAYGLSPPPGSVKSMVSRVFGPKWLLNPLGEKKKLSPPRQNPEYAPFHYIIKLLIINIIQAMFHAQNMN